MAEAVQERRRTLSAIRAGELGPAPQQGVPKPRAMVWPYLLAIEFIAALIVIFFLLVFSVLRDAPLKELANPDVTPNPSKAPWYFVNIQEILVHMDPTLAGVILPGVLFLGLALIPYLDNNPKGVGIWFTSQNGARIAIFSFVYSTLWTILLLLLDAWVGLEPASYGTSGGIRALLNSWGLPDVLGTWVVPLVLMVGLSALLALIVRLRWRADRRDVLIALFSGFVAVYTVTTLSFFLFRGPAQKYYLPWDMGCTDRNHQVVACDAPGAIRYDPFSEF